MGLVKTRRLAAMQKQTTYAKATVVSQRAILLRQGYGGLKAGLKSRPPKVTRPLTPSTRYHRIYINPVVTQAAD